MDKMFYKGIEIHPYDTFYFRDSPRFLKAMRGGIAKTIKAQGDLVIVIEDEDS